MAAADAIMGVSFFRESAPADFETFDVSFFAMCVWGVSNSVFVLESPSVDGGCQCLFRHHDAICALCMFLDLVHEPGGGPARLGMGWVPAME